jgi:hypothetical protein
VAKGDRFTPLPESTSCGNRPVRRATFAQILVGAVTQSRCGRILNNSEQFGSDAIRRRVHRAVEYLRVEVQRRVDFGMSDDLGDLKGSINGSSGCRTNRNPYSEVENA